MPIGVVLFRTKRRAMVSTVSKVMVLKVSALTVNALAPLTVLQAEPS